MVVGGVRPEGGWVVGGATHLKNTTENHGGARGSANPWFGRPNQVHARSQPRERWARGREIAAAPTAQLRVRAAARAPPMVAEPINRRHPARRAAKPDMQAAEARAKAKRLLNYSYDERGLPIPGTSASNSPLPRMRTLK